jgi:nicotinate-nucleotide--dimethylbenzimidazole phosphoribosyltransferase
MGLLRETIAAIQPQDPKWRERARQRLRELTMPHWALGRLMDLAVDLAGITRSMKPKTSRRVVVVMAADHGVAEEGVSKYPQEVTAQMVMNFLRGGAGINALAKVARAKVVVVDMGVLNEIGDVPPGASFLRKKVAPGTKNMAQGPAMSREEAIKALETGISIAMELASRFHILAAGDMGIGNTTPSSAILSVMAGASPHEVTGRGTGLEDHELQRKITVVERAISANRPDPSDPIDVLAKVGGLEIGGIAGFFLGCARARKPALVDGFISTAGALIAKALCPASIEYMIASHRSAERGHRLALEYLGLKPLLDLDLRLGEGTGAALAMPLVEAAARILTDVATFDEARVSRASH